MYIQNIQIVNWEDTSYYHNQTFMVKIIKKDLNHNVKIVN